MKRSSSEANSMVSVNEINELVSIYRQCVKRCWETLDMLTFIDQRLENLHICKKDCVGASISEWVKTKPKKYKYVYQCFVRCMFLWLKHNNMDRLASCISKCVE